MAGEWTITGIVDWIKEREPWLKKELNWLKRFPVVATCTQALEKCDAHEVEQAMMCVIRKARERQQKDEKPYERSDQRQEMYELKYTAIDVKMLCGTQNHQSENQPSVYLFSLYECETGLIIGHVVVEKKTNERTGAKAFLKAPFLSGRICTSDAMHTQKNGLQEYMQNRGIAFLL
jgi:hypothetical protein